MAGRVTELIRQGALHPLRVLDETERGLELQISKRLDVHVTLNELEKPGQL